MNKAETTARSPMVCGRYARRGTCVAHRLPKWGNRFQGGAYFNLGDGNSNPVSSTRHTLIAQSSELYTLDELPRMAANDIEWRIAA